MNTTIAGRDVSRVAMLAVILAVVLAGCRMPFAGMTELEAQAGHDDAGDGQPVPEKPQPPDPHDVEVMTISGPTFTLAWDSGEETHSYRVYSREQGASGWQLLADDITEPQLTVNEGDLPYGTYEFAVRSVSGDGLVSDPHHSFDESAAPEPWVLRWVAG